MAASLPSQQQHQTVTSGIPQIEVLQQLEVLQKMVELQLQSLQELRKQESQSDVIQKEKNLLEGRLMRCLAKQLFLKIGSGIPPHQRGDVHFPNLQHLLYVVDVKDDMVKVINERCTTVEEICMFTDEKIRGIFYSHNDDNELAQILYSQYRRLCTALNILCSYVGRLQNGEKTGELQWSSWFDTLPETPSTDIRAPIANYLQEFNKPNEDILGMQQTYITGTRSIPPSPTLRRHKSSSTIPRSQSDEMNVGHRVTTESTSSTGSSSSSIQTRAKSFGGRGKQRPAPIIITRHTDGDTDSDHSKSRSSSVSQSPRTPTANWNFQMGHTIKHRFSAKQLLISIACDHCHRLMFIGLKCKECGFKCHKKCSSNATPSCGLPEELLRIFKNTYDRKFDGAQDLSLKRTTSEPSDIVHQINISKKTPQNRSHGNLQMYETKEAGPINDSGSITSSASSMSSSPFQSDSPSGTPAELINAELKFDSKFSFPDSNSHLLVPDDTLLETLTSTTSTISTIKSEESTDTYTNPEDSEQSKSSTEKSSASTVSCQDEYSTMDDLHQQISDVVPNHVKLRDAPLSRAEKHFRLSLLHERGSLMSEWVIPFCEVEVGDLIGEGRVGKVYRARWHGEVALKILYLENPTSEEKHDFKYKVQVLRRTRHENLILFMGACMEPPSLAIVCSLCKGSTLYTHIHDHGNTFYDAKLIDIVKQISHGMSYLHAKGIVHRDLKTKNIFLEGNKIVITDFGLISMADVKVTNSKRPKHLIIPKGWLCYQAPEIIRILDPCNPGAEVSLYTNQTDVYAFGSVWFELLAGQWPFEGHSTEAIIWQIGRGFKQPLSKLEISRDMKDIFNMIWNVNPVDRPSFHDVLKAIDTIPKRRLIRSPSQPTYLTRYVNALI